MKEAYNEEEIKERIQFLRQNYIRDKKIFDVLAKRLTLGQFMTIKLEDIRKV